MQEVIEIIEKLKELSGNEQLNYLYSHKDNLLLKEVLQYTYRTDYKYNINKAKLDKALAKVITTSDIKPSDTTVMGKDVWEAYTNALDDLMSKKGVKEADIVSLCQQFFVHREIKSKNLLIGVLLKDLRINMGVISFNKIWSDFQFVYPYMGARPFSEKNLNKITYPAFCQTKMDGLYCNAIVDIDNKKVQYVSRQGKPIGIGHALDETLLSIKCSEKFVLNGEILVWDEKNNKPYPRKIGNGIINRKEKTQEELNAIRYVCWDFIPYKQFVESGIWEVPYERRYNALNLMANLAGDRMMVVDTDIAYNKDEVMEIFKHKYELGEEGIVVKNTSQNWVDGKPSGQVKVKAEKDCDLEMVEFIEGNGTYEGMCGSIRCLSADKKLEVYVKPRTIADATYIWENQEANLGKILAVKYNEKIKSPDKELYSLYLPVFIEIRNDKDIADKLEDIK